MNKKTKKTTTKKQIIIGKQSYINPNTGEIEDFNVINTYDTDFNFEKIWLSHILESLDAIGNQKIKVLNWILSNKTSDNLIIATQRAIAESSGVSYPVVNKTLQSLVLAKALAKKQDGVYMLNPDFIFKGSGKKRMNLLLKFNEIEEIDQKENKLKLENKDKDEGVE